LGRVIENDGGVWNMKIKQTKNQVARGSRPDGESFNKLLLIKRASEQRATYQIRLLVYRAVQEGKKLIIEVRKDCKVHHNLRELTKQYPNNVTIERA
jgi:hypothetical protein